MKFNKEDLKKLLELNSPIIVDELAEKIKPQIKLVYLFGLILVATIVLASLAALLTGGVSGSIVLLAFALVEFVIVRMLCEFIAFK